MIFFVCSTLGSCQLQQPVWCISHDLHLHVQQHIQFPFKTFVFSCVEKPLNLLLTLRKGTFYSEPFPKPKQIVWMGTMNQINEKKNTISYALK